MIKLMEIIYSLLLAFEGAGGKAVISGLILEKSKQYDLDPKVVAAIIYQESGGNTFASRKENRFYDKYIAKHTRETLPGFVPRFPPTLTTEKQHRATSWGLMQVMGETAREMGYKAKYLNRLMLPHEGIDMGCHYLRHLLNSETEGSEKERYTKALRRYNGGAEYPGIIWGHIESGAYREILSV